MTTSHTFEEDMLFHGEGIEVASVIEVRGHNVKRRNMESSSHEFIEEVAAHVDDHRKNPVTNNDGRGESNAHVGHSRGEDHVAANIQEKDVTNVPVINASSVQDTEEMDSALGTTELGGLVRKDQKWIPTINALTHVAEGNYSTDRLDKMWVQQQPKGDIDALDHEQWGMFNGTYFQTIKLSKLLERQSSEATPKKDSTLTEVHDAVSSLLMIASISSTMEKHAGDDFERVLEILPDEIMSCFLLQYSIVCKNLLGLHTVFMCFSCLYRVFECRQFINPLPYTNRKMMMEI
jgi:hypothetical protein